MPKPAAVDDLAAVVARLDAAEARIAEQEAALAELGEQHEAAVARLEEVEQDTRDLRQNVRGKLREHLADHADAGYDFRRWREQSGRPERPAEDVAAPS